MISIPGSLSLLFQVGDDVIRPCKSQIRVPRFIRSLINCPIQSRLRFVYVERNEMKSRLYFQQQQK